MNTLKDILYKVRLINVVGLTDVGITSVCFDSRKAAPGSLFIALKGTQIDGHEFIEATINAGAVAIVCQDLPIYLNKAVTYIKVQDTSLALAVIASNFYNNPSAELQLVGVTGTNGKTTTVTLLFNLFKNLGYKTGLLSTVKNQINEQIIPSTHTTPDALQLNALLREMVDNGCTHCFMEVSSHAIIQNRTAGIHFAGAIFTNLTHDHLDYHKTFDAYIKAKKQLFDSLSETAFALVNKDDANGLLMLQNTKALKKTYALKTFADFKCNIIENQFSGLLLHIDGAEVWTKLIGKFNAYNLLAVYSTAILLKQDKINTLTTLSTLNTAEGRFQHIKTKQGIIGIVDYAHTPDALLNVLQTIKNIRTGNEQVITVIGCGGNRDTHKRPLMAKIACEWSDKIILTSDNPRDEDPETIIAAMQTGIIPLHYKKYITITDRKEAIKTACVLAKPGDIILIAGKGHEKYQEIKNIKHPFDDMQLLNNNLIILEK